MNKYGGVSSQIYPREREATMIIGQETELDTEQVSTFRRREKSLPIWRIEHRFFGHPAHILVTILTELPLLHTAETCIKIASSN